MTLNQHWGKPNSKYPGSLWKENALLGRKTMPGGWASKKLPPFPPSHELLHLSLQAHILDGFRIASKSTSVNDWLATKPSWTDIELLSAEVFDKLFTAQPVEKMRRKTLRERDVIFENTILLNRDMIMYVEMVAAVKRGDIGTVMNIMWHWAVMMRGTGAMPKYADALLKVRHMLASWPEEVRNAFVMNWLVNLSGKEGGYKEVDLLQEHHNFWAKVSNFTSPPRISSLSAQLLLFQVQIDLVRKRSACDGDGKS